MSDRCPKTWCAYPMPHVHTQGTADAARPKPTFDTLLNDPAQHLDPDSIVARTVFDTDTNTRPRLTTAEREWLSNETLHGYDAVVAVVEQILASRAPVSGAVEGVGAMLPMRVENVAAGVCNVGPAVESRWRRGPHWHTIWPEGEHWCFETETEAIERAIEVRDIWRSHPHLAPTPVAKHEQEVAATALREAADRMPAFHDRDVPEWAITSACKWLRKRADALAARTPDANPDTHEQGDRR